MKRERSFAKRAGVALLLLLLLWTASQLASGVPLVASLGTSVHTLGLGDYSADTLAGETIPLQVRILSVADVFDALTSDRPYRNAMSVAEATELITHESGRQFDPSVVKAFRARAAGIVTILKQQRAKETTPGNFPPPFTAEGSAPGNSPPPLAGEGRVGADVVLKKAS